MTQEVINMGPPKISKSSRKLKKSWRKNIDITEVEDALEVERFEVRIGGGFIDKKSEDFFMLDQEGGDDSKVEANEESYEDKLTMMKKKKFKCFELLEGLPGAPDPVSSRKKVRTEEAKLTEPMQEKKQAKQLKRLKVGKAVKHQMMETLKKTEHLRKAGRRAKFDFDLWGEEAKEKKDPNLTNEWVKPETRFHTDIWTNKFTAGKLRNKKPNSLVPNVEVPHSGQSYNPALSDHQDILWKAAMIEIDKEKKEKKLDRSLTGMFPTKDQAPTQQSYMAEMSVGLPGLDDETEENEKEVVESEDENGDMVPKKSTTKPKTRLSFGCNHIYT
jgi:nucleolar protein 53